MNESSDATVNAPASVKVSDPKVHRKIVKFNAENGEPVELEAVYEDSLSSGSSLGTVVGFHGAPGSHNDFKYIRDKLDGMGVRFIGLNYPGFGNTLAYSDQQHTNQERQNYTNALLDELGIDGKVIFMGHSRGCENALLSAVERSGDGLILVNPTGLRPHKGLRPTYRLTALHGLYSLMPAWMGDSMLYRVFLSIGFRVKPGEESISSLRAAMSLSLEDMIECIEKSNEKEIKKLIVFGGSDHLVEEEIVFEKLEKHAHLKHFEFEENLTDADKNEVTQEICENRGASVFVKKDTHFQNKSQADLIAKSCLAMLK